MDFAESRLLTATECRLSLNILSCSTQPDLTVSVHIYPFLSALYFRSVHCFFHHERNEWNWNKKWKHGNKKKLNFLNNNKTRQKVRLFGLWWPRMDWFTGIKCSEFFLTLKIYDNQADNRCIIFTFAWIDFPVNCWLEHRRHKIEPL